MNKIYTFKELGEHIGISKDLLHVYLAHFTLTKYIINSKEKKHALSAIISKEFINDFITYLKIGKRRTYDLKRINYIKRKLEELLKCEIHQEMRGTTCTNPPTIA